MGSVLLRALVRSPTVAACALVFAGIAAGADAGEVGADVVFEGIYSRAEVSSPRGRFVTEIVSLADGRVRFLEEHPHRRTELLLAGGQAFGRGADGAGLTAAAAETVEIVRGHDVHRMVLARGGQPERIELPEPEGSDRGPVVIELADWRPVYGVALPSSAAFLHAGERFDYRYVAVLPFRLAPGVALPTDPAALLDRLGDLGQIAAAHERVMAAHRASDAAALVADAAPRGIVSGRGELSESRREDLLERMRGYLGAIRFSRYADTVPPVIAVSADGTLSWLACAMEAEGTRSVGGKSEPLAYAFSWVELYARDAGAGPGGGRWVGIGNASSQRP